MIGGWEEYVNFLHADENDQCMEYSMMRKTDDEASDSVGVNAEYVRNGTD